MITLSEETRQALAQLFSELAQGPKTGEGAYVVNSGDVGLLRSLDKLSPDEASHSTNDGATIAAHAEHVRYGLSLLNRWTSEGGNPFADAAWDEAWKISGVDATKWEEIRNGLRTEAERWTKALQITQNTSTQGLLGMIGSVAHLAYHVGAIRQIAKGARGPKEGDFA
jgi:hypothetical protein